MGKPLGGKQDFSHEISSRNGEDVDCLMSCKKKTLWKLGEENVDGHLILNCSCRPSNGIRYCQCSAIDNVAISFDRSGSNVSSVRLRTDSSPGVQVLCAPADVRESVPLIAANNKSNNETRNCGENSNSNSISVQNNDAEIDMESSLSSSTQSSSPPPSSTTKKLCNVSIPNSSSIHQNSVNLDTLLRCIPLAYSPRTKQLHIISVEDHEADSPKEVNECSLVNGRQLECIDETPEADGENEKHCSEIIIPDESRPFESPKSTLQRVGASSASLSRTDASSFSSISSLSTNADSSLSTPPTVAGEELGLLTDRVRQCSAGSVSGDEVCNGCLTPDLNGDVVNKGNLVEDDESQGAKPKRRGITGFLTRFSWKTKDGITPPGSPSSSWRLFNNKNGNSSIPNGTQLDANQEQSELQDDSVFLDSTQQLKSSQQCIHPSSNKSKRLIEFNPSSTTALILENRPLNLPAKPAEEELRHRQQYEQMVEAVKKRELKDAKLRKRLLQRQLKHEETIVQAARIWNNEILPNWETMKSSRKARELWWNGIPPAVRGKVWKLAIGNDLNITAELYEICVNRARDRIRMASESASMSEDEPEDSSPDKESSVELIKLDVSRTFPQLCIFQKGGPYYDLLHSLLGAYVCYRPDIGYMQGMSFLAAVLILNLEVDDAFICFANLLNKPCQLAFFRVIESMMKSYFKTYEEFFMENLPKLFHHFEKQKVEPDLYLIDWIYTLYSKSLPLDVASRVWDVFFRDGEEFLFQAALGILHLYQDILLDMDFIHIAQFLTKLPDDIVASRLFQSIEIIRMNIDKKHFSHVLAFHSDPTDT